MKFRTLLLLGFTAGAGMLSGCIIETTSGGSSATCADNQYFNIRWGVESAAAPLTCEQAPLSHVQLSTNRGTLLDVGVGCNNSQRCSNGIDVCNFSGSTLGNVPVGTTVVLASLISGPEGTAGTLLSSGAPGELAIARCTAVDLSIIFPIN